MAEPAGRDEWTLIVPRGRMASAEAYAEHCGLNIREMVESPLTDHFILINDSAIERAFSEPIRPFLYQQPPPLPRWTWQPQVNVPMSLTLLSGI